MRLLLTGFGPFLQHATNPSQVLAESSERPHQILEVSYRFVDEWIAGLDESAFDGLLLIGLNAGATSLRFERFGHNRIGRTPDVRGYVPYRRRIEEDGPWRAPSTLWSGELARASFCRRNPEFSRSGSAGGYLCNYVLYRTLRRFPDKRVGFLHVPPFKKIDEGRQKELLRDLVERIESGRGDKVLAES